MSVGEWGSSISAAGCYSISLLPRKQPRSTALWLLRPPSNSAQQRARSCIRLNAAAANKGSGPGRLAPAAHPPLQARTASWASSCAAWARPGACSSPARHCRWGPTLPALLAVAPGLVHCAGAFVWEQQCDLQEAQKDHALHGFSSRCAVSLHISHQSFSPRWQFIAASSLCTPPASRQTQTINA